MHTPRITQKGRAPRVAGAALALTIALVGLTAVSSAQAATCFGAEATISGTSGADRIVGTNRRDVIQTAGGRDVIYGRGGNDWICSGSEPDRVKGGPGNDRILGSRSLEYGKVPRE